MMHITKLMSLSIIKFHIHDPIMLILVLLEVKMIFVDSPGTMQRKKIILQRVKWQDNIEKEHDNVNNT